MAAVVAVAVAALVDTIASPVKVLALAAAAAV
jgi:hypothetical protein